MCVCVCVCVCVQEILILKQPTANCVTDASICVKLISKNSNTLEIEHSLLKGLFRLDTPTSKRRRRYFIKIITWRVRCECFD